MSHLSQEIATYYRHLPELLTQQGKFVLIKGTELIAVRDTYLDALTEGYQRFKLTPFMAQRIMPLGYVTFSRDLIPSRPPQASSTLPR